MASEAAPTAREHRQRTLGSRALGTGGIGSRALGARAVRLSESGDHQHLYSGFTNALASAVELVLTPLIFVLFGLFIDDRVGTRPVIAIIFGVLALTGVVVKTYYAYRAEFARQEEGKPWKR